MDVCPNEPVIEPIVYKTINTYTLGIYIWPVIYFHTHTVNEDIILQAAPWSW